jgi:hypothetical protein
MNAVLVFIDGTICDTRQRHHLSGTPQFHQPAHILKDLPVPGCVDALQELARDFEIVYIGARPPIAEPATQEWLEHNGFPQGKVLLHEEQSGRLESARRITGRYTFLAGIGDRWDDNELHRAVGCLSIILQEFNGNWSTVVRTIVDYEKQRLVARNRVRLEGKVEGLARVCPLLLSRVGDNLWKAYHQAVQELADSTRDSRRIEDLASFNQNKLDPENLADVARWHELTNEEEWRINPLFGLQERELIECSHYRYIHKVTRCYYADLWKTQGLTEIGYQSHCATDAAWWDRPAWNPRVRFEQPQTLMQGADSCIFIQYIPEGENANDQ